MLAFFRLSLEGKIDVYLRFPFWEQLVFWLETCINTHDFAVYKINIQYLTIWQNWCFGRFKHLINDIFSKMLSFLCSDALAVFVNCVWRNSWYFTILATIALVMLLISGHLTKFHQALPIKANVHSKYYDSGTIRICTISVGMKSFSRFWRNHR